MNKEQFWEKKIKRKTDIVALGDPAVLSSGPLIHDCNPTTLHVCTHTFTDRGCNNDPVFFFLFHIKDI